MFNASVSYWERCASSVITMMSSRSDSTGISLARLGRPELVDQREHVAVVLTEQLPQVRRRLGVHVRRRS